MFAVVVQSTISDYEKAKQGLQERLIPMLQQRPGFKSGYWLAPLEGNRGMSFTIWETESAARDTLAELQPGSKPMEWVTIESSELREVAASA